MTAVQLRKLIDQDISQDAVEQGLYRYFQKRGPLLHPSIRLLGADPTDKLYNFTLVYTRHAPDLIMDVRREACSKSLDPLIEKTLEVAESFFTQPPELSDIPLGMLNSIAASYLAHRLVEEMNDIFHMCLGQSLWNHDITHANLLVYEILGDSFANRLDVRVSTSVQALTQGPSGLFENAQFKRLQQRHANESDARVA